MSVMRFLAGFAVGAALGALAGVLLAPKSGEESRKEIDKFLEDVTLRNFLVMSSMEQVNNIFECLL